MAWFPSKRIKWYSKGIIDSPSHDLAVSIGRNSDDVVKSPSAHAQALTETKIISGEPSNALQVFLPSSSVTRWALPHYFTLNSLPCSALTSQSEKGTWFQRYVWSSASLKSGLWTGTPVWWSQSKYCGLFPPGTSHWSFSHTCNERRRHSSEGHCLHLQSQHRSCVISQVSCPHTLGTWNTQHDLHKMAVY